MLSVVKTVLSLAATAMLTACLSPAYVNRGDGRDVEDPKGDIGAILMDPVTYAVREAYYQTPPRCIAVMPLLSIRDQDTGEPIFTQEQLDLVRRAFYASLAPSELMDVELEPLDEILARQEEAKGNPFKHASIMLGCDAYLVGEVTAYSNEFYGVYSRVRAGARVRLLRARDGVELWQASHVAESHGGGLILSPFSVVTGIFDASSNARDEQIHRVTADLARRLVATLPGFDGEPVQNLTVASGSKTDPTAKRNGSNHGLWSAEALGDGSAMVVTADRLNVRAGPGRDYPVLLQVKRGAHVLAVDDPLADGWTAVRLNNGTHGFVASAYVSARVSAPQNTVEEATKPKSAPVTPVSSHPAKKQLTDQPDGKSVNDDLGTLF